MKKFIALSLSDVVFYHANKTIGILTFMCRINFVQFYNLGARTTECQS